MQAGYQTYYRKPGRIIDIQIIALILIRGLSLKNFALVIDGSPEIVGFAVDPHENLV